MFEEREENIYRNSATRRLNRESKNWLNMPTLHSHTHCQVAPADTQTKTWQRVCLSYCTNGQRKKTTKAQHCIRAIASKVVKSMSTHLINFCG